MVSTTPFVCIADMCGDKMQFLGLLIGFIAIMAVLGIAVYLEEKFN
jgi:hypothetical protein